jgi:hypothetical protein
MRTTRTTRTTSKKTSSRRGGTRRQGGPPGPSGHPLKHIEPISLERPVLDGNWSDEPSLLFAGDNMHPDPKVGIPLYGPRSLGTTRHKQEVHVGFLGTSEAIEHAISFYGECAEGVPGDEEHAPFPGCKPDLGYRCAVRLHDQLRELITRRETTEILAIKSGRERFEQMVGLLREKMRVLTERDHPLDYVVLVLPEDLYRRCRVADYREKGLGAVHRDLRRAFKALAMEFRMPTQILLETTTGLTTSRRKLDQKSVIAWNLFTGMYAKIDGLPWGPTGLPPSSCYIGVSFHRPLGNAALLRSSVIQAFDEHGEGLVLRGESFPWDEKKQGKSPHLSEEQAERLVTMVLDAYASEQKQQLPQRVVVHKTSRFEPAERAGFEQALKRVALYDLVALSPESGVRLVRQGQYPPLRGASFSVGDLSYLYTSGYLTTHQRYPHGHVPSPLRIADHVGDTSRAQLMRETMVLTKMNWNSANMSGLMPITLRFSRLVGDVLREVPEHQIPQRKYKYYM